jgi:anaerobic selenocysteine-containing dehydrogenase
VDRVNKGRLDPKDLFGWQANESEDRLRRPLVRKDGELVEANWDEAFERIVGRSKALLEEKGPLAFGFYTTGKLFLEEYYTLGVIGKAWGRRIWTAIPAFARRRRARRSRRPSAPTDSQVPTQT